MGERRRRDGERRPGDEEQDCEAPDAGHVSERSPPRPVKIAIPATTSATIESTRATMPLVEVPPPPPNDETDSRRGAGSSEFSGPVQSTTDPSEYVCRTLKMYVFDDPTLALKR